MDDKKLFLIDAYAIIYRAYYALIRSPRVTSKGFNTSAIFGFCNALDDILRKENPSHIAVCFDPVGGHTFRHKMYPEYKAQRDKQPEDITLAIPYIKNIIRALNIPVIEIPEYEADDIIGTLARRAEAEGFDTYMMTPDKDYGQLVTDHIFMYRPSLRGQGFEVRGVKQVCERYGIERPSQMIDLLALEGDASDNIPGCPGIGEKTAVKLIAQFGSVENLLDHVDEVKGANRLKIENNAEQIRFSKQLVTIKTDVPMSVEIEGLKRKPENVEQLREIYTELEFKSFLSRLAPKPEPSNKPIQGSLFDTTDNLPVIETSAMPVKYYTFNIKEIVTITDLAEAADYIALAAKEETVGLATYAPGDEAMTAKLRGLAIALPGELPRYFRLPSEATARQEWLVALEPIFASKATIVSHDVKRDLIILKNNGIDLSAPYFDTAVAHYLLQPEMRHKLLDVANLYYEHDLDLDPANVKKNFPELDAFEAARITGNRAGVTAALRRPLTDDLKTNALWELYNDIELPFVEVLALMEYTGVRVDTDELNRLTQQLTARLREMERRCYELAGHPFNISSPKQVGVVLFDELQIDPKAKKTKSGSYSTTEEILEKYAPDHEIVGLILKMRAVTKLLATYTTALPALINPATGKIHTTFNQTVTATGRISSTNPNLQNIPIRTDDGREIRRAFIPDPGDIFLSADYSQIELRLMADLSGDPDMIAAFTEGDDIHRATAAKIYKVPLDEVTDAQRRNAKTANFGIIYGISAFGLSERLGIPRSEAKMLIDGYFASYPHIREYIDRAVDRAREQGYVTTIMGRRRQLPDITSRNAVVRAYAERNAVNAPIQGSAADIIKLAMIRIHREILRRGLRSRMILQVHDELNFNVVPEELPELQALVIREMEGAYSGRVRLEVSSGVGRNWLEAH